MKLAAVARVRGWCPPASVKHVKVTMLMLSGNIVKEMYIDENDLRLHVGFLFMQAAMALGGDAMPNRLKLVLEKPNHRVFKCVSKDFNKNIFEIQEVLNQIATHGTVTIYVVREGKG